MVFYVPEMRGGLKFVNHSDILFFSYDPMLMQQAYFYSLNHSWYSTIQFILI